MLRVVLPVVILAVTVFAVVECIQTDESELRNLPKIVWILLIVIAAPVGAIAWLIAGRPQSILPGGGGLGGRGGQGGYPPPGNGGNAGRPRPPAPRGPDDDPDFLGRL